MKYGNVAFLRQRPIDNMFARFKIQKTKIILRNVFLKWKRKWRRLIKEEVDDVFERHTKFPLSFSCLRRKCEYSQERWK